MTLSTMSLTNLSSGINCTLNYAILLYTDYTSMELYAFTPEVINKLIKVLAPRLKISGTELLERIQGILQMFFALRLANRELMFGLAWVDTEKCCNLTNSYLAFD